ncbi:MAG: hemerythrin family protein [Spirochaetaceae bacterium]|jgi:hemerythrin|nr:hemerythrin family protein [Spirochaetaceae bacterium]
MAYKWDSSLETGYELIDNQHKQLVSALNKLLEACREGHGKEKLAQTLDFLTGYTIKHFADEEKLQIKYQYPDYLTHKQYHDDFKITVKDLAEQLIEEGPTDELVGMVNTSIGDWLLNHIKGDDFRMAAYVKAQNIS